MITPMPEPDTFDVLVLGAGPAGVVAALRAVRLGARTVLVTRDQFGDMPANDGPANAFGRAAITVAAELDRPRMWAVESHAPGAMSLG